MSEGRGGWPRFDGGIGWAVRRVGVNGLSSALFSYLFRNWEMT